MGNAVSIESAGTKMRLILMEILPLDTVLGYRILTANTDLSYVMSLGLGFKKFLPLLCQYQGGDNVV